MRLVDQWRELERALPDDWTDARFELRLPEGRPADRAAAVFAPLAPARGRGVIRFSCARRGGGPAPEAVRRGLRRLDEERVAGELRLLAAREAGAAEPGAAPGSLAADWDAEVGRLPADWSDVYGEVELRSSDHLERAALLLAPLNPARYGSAIGFRFRVARRAGYGASAEMTRRCLARCDDERLAGRFRILRALSNTDHVDTQGPVWYVGGRSV